MKPSHIEGSSYPVWVGFNSLSKLSELLPLTKYSRVAALVDAALLPAWADHINNALPKDAKVIPVSVSEKEKNIQSATKIWQELLGAGLDRRSIVFGIGGGVLCDIAGFAAATYMRGCDFVTVPTTLLSQVDASVGGKTGVNFGGVKNLVGTISQPVAVIADLSFLSTLPQREFISGLAELFKHGLIADRQHLEEVAGLRADTSNPKLEGAVRRSLALKIGIVSNDPKENGVRKLLNFGHSIGHALEAVALEHAVILSHGEAIAIGMVAESYLSVGKGWLSNSDLIDIEGALERCKLPTRVPAGIPQFEIPNKLTHDKKNFAGVAKFTLLKKIGEAVYDCEVSNAELVAALDYVFLANQNR